MRHQSTSNIENKIFFSKFKPDKKIGEGSFGKIYSAHNINTGEKFALKLESRNISQPLLDQEAQILCYLKGEGIPLIKTFGFSGDYNVLVMELLGKSLEDLFEEKGCKFSIKTVCMLGHQMISRLQYIHSKHILHRDIKPDNFLMGTGENAQTVYLIDFGLSKKYRSSRTLQHIKYGENKKLTGTARYASIHALKGCEQGRRDDVEALGYVLLYFLRGTLPWQGLKVKKNEDKYKKIYEKKKATSPNELCAGFPPEFCEFVTYTRSLKFEEEPNYDLLRGYLKKVMDDLNLEWDLEFDWKSKKSPNIASNKENHNISNNKEENNNDDNNNNNNSGQKVPNHLNNIEKGQLMHSSKILSDKSKNVLNAINNDEVNKCNHNNYHENNNINSNNISHEGFHIAENQKGRLEKPTLNNDDFITNPKTDDTCILF